MKLMNDNIDAPLMKSESNDARFFEAMSCSNSLDKSAMSIIRSEMMSQPKAIPLVSVLGLCQETDKDLKIEIVKIIHIIFNRMYFRKG